MTPDDDVDAFGFSNESTHIDAGATQLPAHGLAPGAKIGDLELIRQVGRGAQGVVFEGRQDGQEQSVAVKAVAKDESLGAEQQERFRREAEAAGRLSHPNIVAVHGLRETEHFLLLLQEFVTGGDLAEQLKADTGADELPDAARIRRAVELHQKLAGALQHAHDHGVIHRDIKPDNVLVTEDGEPKLTDFGLARMGDKLGLSRTGEIMGTPHYMSPEQVAANPRGIDARTDVYSLGAMLYRFLTGTVPLEAKTLQATFHKILTVPPRPLRGVNPNIPADLEAVCLKALRKTPEERYTTAGELAADLGRHLAGQSTLARPEGAFVRTVRLLRRQSSPTLMLIAALLVVVWVALDALVLLPMARREFDNHFVRMGVLTAIGLLFVWTLTSVTPRWIGKRVVAYTVSWVFALSLWFASGWGIWEDRLDHLQGAERALLEARLEAEPVGSRPDVSDVVAYVDGWEARFGPLDALLLARGYLKRERPLKAATWVERLDDTLLDSPVEDALRLAIADTLGSDDTAAIAAQLLAPGREAEWSAWTLAGDILRDMGRPDAAYEAYLRAGRRPDAPRDELNLQLAQVSIDLCHWDDVDEYLDDYLKWFPEDPVGHLLKYRIEAGSGMWSEAQTALDAYVESGAGSTLELLRMEHRLRALQGRHAEAWQLVRQTIEEHADDDSLLGWGGQLALAEQRMAMASMSAAGAAGDADGAAAALQHASDALDVAEAAYVALGEQPNGRFTSEIGQSAIAIKRADVDREHRLDWLARAAEHAERARDIDPTYWQAYYNLGHARFNTARTEAGSSSPIPLEVLEEYVEFMRQTIARNGLHYLPLNNAAYVLGRFVHGVTADPADLEEAFELARRAVRLTDPARGGGKCSDAASDLEPHSSAYDTLRELQEVDGDLEGALQSARMASSVLAPRSAKRPRRDAEVARLEELLR